MSRGRPRSSVRAAVPRPSLRTTCRLCPTPAAPVTVGPRRPRAEARCARGGWRRRGAVVGARRRSARAPPSGRQHDTPAVGCDGPGGVRRRVGIRACCRRSRRRCRRQLCVVRGRHRAQPPTCGRSGVGGAVRIDPVQSGAGLAHRGRCARDRGAAGHRTDCRDRIPIRRRVPQCRRGGCCTTVCDGYRGRSRCLAGRCRGSGGSQRRRVGAHLGRARIRSCGSRFDGSPLPSPRRGKFAPARSVGRTRRGRCPGQRVREPRRVGVVGRPAGSTRQPCRHGHRSGDLRSPAGISLGPDAMSVPSLPLGVLAFWSLTAVGVTAAFGLLADGERRRRNRRHLTALGWTAPRLAVLAMVIAVSAFGIAFVASTRFSDAAAASPALALAWSLLTAVAVAWAVPGLVATSTLAGNRRRLDDAVLLWLRRIRLFVAAGHPISVAVLDAAERVSDPAFAPAAGAVNAAVLGGRDPLAAVAAQLADSPTASLLRTVDAAERSGAAASQLLDRVLDRVVRAMDDRRRESIDRLGRSVGASASLLAVVASAVVMVTIVMTLPSV
ncbi:MAG: type II secretion system F family protein [Acidimicrobiales bacterium]|nr:type II secretion system F family protein [Acidimicrobiales bacterium]